MIKKRILLTNDDGFDSEGLLALHKALLPFGEITVVAPANEKSACGHSLTLTRPLRFIEVGERFYKLDDATPSDCIFLALNKLFTPDNPPDLIISGINVGANMGEDISYSGTVAGSKEAVLQGIPSLAISQIYHNNKATLKEYGYTLAQESIIKLVEKIFNGSFPLPPRKLININIPAISPDKCKGFKVTRAGNKRYDCHAEVHYNPRGVEYYWIGLPRLEWIENQGYLTDFEATQQGYISLTPVTLDMTAHEDIEALEGWL